MSRQVVRWAQVAQEAPPPAEAVEVTPKLPGKHKRRRGDVQRAILECLREGHATPRQIRAACAERGLQLTGNSVSNCLARLAEKGFVRGIPQSDGWEVTNSDNLKQALEASIKEEGSKVIALKPSDKNGTAGMYPVAAVPHTAGA